MIESLIKELNELLEYKKKCEYLQKDKQRMSDYLFEYMMYKYDNTSHEERSKEYNRESCSCCRLRDYCELRKELPENILKPVASEDAWIPGKQACGKFEWS